MNCKLCSSENVETIYSGPIRSGGASSGHEKGFCVKECTACGIVFLDPFPKELQQYYETQSYWSEHHGDLDLKKLYKKLAPEQERWFQEIGEERVKGKRIADYGCGIGVFLDLIKSTANETIGIEPAKHFHAYLSKRGHLFFGSSEELKNESIDMAVSFDALEHLEDPIALLKEVFRALMPGGWIFLGVPNQNDFLKKIVPAYLAFFYHKSHLFYFSEKSLMKLLREVGFDRVKVRYVHKYDLMNLVVWARDGKGQGKQGSSLFDGITEESYRKNLERQGFASHLLLEAQKAKLE